MNKEGLSAAMSNKESCLKNRGRGGEEELEDRGRHTHEGPALRRACEGAARARGRGRACEGAVCARGRGRASSGSGPRLEGAARARSTWPAGSRREEEHDQSSGGSVERFISPFPPFLVSPFLFLPRAAGKKAGNASRAGLFPRVLFRSPARASFTPKAAAICI